MQTHLSNTASLTDLECWSHEEFGNAALGNTKRTRRLVSIASRTAERSCSQITQMCSSSAERQGAYKFFENNTIRSSQVGRSAYHACAKRCEGEEFIFVPVDGSTLSIDDDSDTKELGPTGPKGSGSGLEAMTAIAVRSDGVPLGISSQVFWTREKGQKNKKTTRRKRSIQDKETRYWLEAIEQTESIFKQENPDCKRWYQLDRGADFSEMLFWAVSSNSWVTLRASQNRKVNDAETDLLWETVESSPSCGEYSLTVPGRSGMASRDANLEVRYCEVKIKLPQRSYRKAQEVHLTAVLVSEKHPMGPQKIEWLLLTNHTVSNFEEAKRVIDGYSQRWKIEEFHKSWKSVCKVEEIQLRKYEGILKLAVICAAVAIRIERLKYLARRSPDLPASVEFGQQEIDTLIILTKPKGYKRGDMPTIADTVLWLANYGGYTGKSSGGPPGTIVLGRGLARLRDAVAMFEALS